MSAKKSASRTEFGDFQTPLFLSETICKLLYSRGLRPLSVLEPTCGRGNFLFAALDTFESIEKAIGVDINPVYVDHVGRELSSKGVFGRAKVIEGDFFALDWPEVFKGLQEPILVIGNPPWVTNAELAKLDSGNLPEKTNFHRLSGFDAISGRSNFDISEWMLINLLEALDGSCITLAMLCKVAVARKVLTYAWTHHLRVRDCSIHLVDAKSFFDASVPACLLICHSHTNEGDQSCAVYEDLDFNSYESTFGIVDGRLIANRFLYGRWKHLEGNGPYHWRSGIKHDSSKIMELIKLGKRYQNGLDELYDLENTYLFPMLKSSQVANRRMPEPTKWMIVTQSYVGEDTRQIREVAPRTWQYLVDHRGQLDKRKSSIYRNRPSFSIFGIGEYTFSPWKVAISGFYKKIRFTVVGPHLGKPVVLDDTCYFIACQNEDEANFVSDLLNSEIAAQFYSAFVFWDDKRPITSNLLKRLNIVALAKELGSDRQLGEFLQYQERVSPSYEQMRLLD